MEMTIIKGNINHIVDCENDIGYSVIGDIPDLYREGITECLMMKSRGREL